MQGTCTRIVRSTNWTLHRGLLQPRWELHPHPPPTYTRNTYAKSKAANRTVVSLGISSVIETVLSAGRREKRSRMFTSACEAQGRVFRVFCKRKTDDGAGARVCGNVPAVHVSAKKLRRTTSLGVFLRLCDALFSPVGFSAARPRSPRPSKLVYEYETLRSLTRRHIPYLWFTSAVG